MRLLFVVAALAVVSCSGQAPCGPSTCATGCCDATGVCRASPDSSACGRGGAVCSACGAGQTCFAGACSSLGPGGSSGGGSSGAGGGTSSVGGGSSGVGGGSSGVGGGSSGVGGGSGQVDCTRPAPQIPTGGCTLSLVAPANCSTVSFNNGFFELSWTTSTTFCEGPHRLYVAGSPVSSWTEGEGNVLQFELSSGTYENYAMTRNIGGYYLITQPELARLSAVNGQYYFRVESWSGSLSETGTFLVR